jgi:Tol biopolymer transport system component
MILSACTPSQTFTPTVRPVTITPSPYATFTPVPTFTPTLTPPPLNPNLRIVQMLYKSIFIIDLMGNIEEIALPDDLEYMDDGTEQQHLMWSPDNELMVFSPDHQQGNHLYLFNWKSKTVELIGNSSAANPFWSPNGKSLTFVRGVGEYYVLSIYDRSTKKVDEIARFHERIRYLSWSPDGDWIAFLMDGDGQGNLGDQCFYPVYDCGATSLYVIHPDGSQLTKLHDATWRTVVYRSYKFPSWSYDGYWVAITEIKNSEKSIVLINPETGEQIRVSLPSNLDIHSYPIWSPKDNIFLFEGGEGEHSGIYKFDLESRQIIKLTSSEISAFSPSFSPDGEWIGFIVDREGSSNTLYIIRPDGSSAIKIADGDWQPMNSHSWFSTTEMSNP